MIKVCPQCDRKYPEDIEFCAQDGTRLHELEDESSDPLIGRALDGRWVIEKQIGVGGMGAVYLGSQRSVDRKVAIKTLKPELSNSREFVDRFFREARVATKISHPNCVTILDFGQTSDDTLYLAMEFLDGMELSERLEQGELKVRDIIEICIQISSALAAAHANDIIHRDLKPDNIYLLSISDESIFIKVLDFGIAKVLGAEKQMTQTGQVFGTPEYMSPEQCRGDLVDGRSDLYSLGCIMYRMLAGHPPFQADTPMAILVAHVSQDPVDIRELITRDDIPDAFADLCMRLLSKQADDRPADAQAVRAELEAILDLTTTQATPAVRSKTTPAVAGAPADTAADGGSPVPAAPGPHSTGESQKTSLPDGMTRLPSEFEAEPKKSPLPIILGLMILLVLGSGCAFGVYFAVFAPSDGDSNSGFLASIFGGDDSKATGEDEPTGEAAIDDDDEVAVNDLDDTPENAPGTDDEPVAVVPTGEDPAQANPQDDPAPGTELAQNSATKDEKTPLSPGVDMQNKKDTPKTDPGKTEPSKSTANDNAPEKNGSQNVVINTNTVEVNARDKETNTQPTKPKEKPTAEKPKKPEPTAPTGNMRQGSLSAAGEACLEPDVDKVLKSASRQFLSCYNDALETDATASGKIMMSWNITPDGGILSPSVQVSDISSMNSCMIAKLKRLRFAPLQDGRCYVRVTYNFSP
ncbi:protein kinase domain-containing protein [Bradymonas sediminis]|uniref:non-specific serine/threonine protein kinase n=1 Tax=Bradymonas sediminis TaxID=1548548 RepID=A0A2Z4FHG2_9DELT|nr:protein kinase [Bradymonas sediminis]AWV88431.1 hypothetical protein DN745_03340 [Bradymonas sediminis]TDP77560.1 serine/threonine protein kinase [Bradymonas sediminis]